MNASLSCNTQEKDNLDNNMIILQEKVNNLTRKNTDIESINNQLTSKNTQLEMEVKSIDSDYKYQKDQ